MSIQDIKNRNFQSQLNFDFRIDRLPDFNFFVQKISIPQLTIAQTSNGGDNPFTKIPWPGDHMTFGDLSIDFKVGEGLRNWYEIFAWMQGISFPERQSQYGDLKRGLIKDLDGNTKKASTPRSNGDVYGQGVLMINSSANNPQISIKFIDLYPVGLSEAIFDTVDTDVTYVTCTATFKYDYFIVEKVV